MICEILSTFTFEEENTMNRPKRHHYVPEMLLRNFTNKNGRLHFFRKSSKEKCILETEPRNFCVECELYTVYDSAGAADASLEKYLSQLEGEAAPVIMKIIKEARAGKPPGLTSSEKETWDRFLVCQWARTPDTTDQVLSRRKKKTKEELAALKEEIGKEHLFYDLPNPPQYRLEILGNKGLLVAVIHNSKKSFVIGSSPVARFGHGIPLTDPTVEFWLPVAPDIAVTPYFARGHEELREAQDATIEKINKEIFRQSSAIGGCSGKSIASLAGLPLRNK